MSDRAYFYLGRALPLLVFGFLVAVQGSLAVAGVEHALTGQLGRSDAMYLLNRFLAVAFFSLLLVIYLFRGKPVAKDHNPIAVVVAMVGSFVLYGLFLIPGQTRSTDLRVLALSDILLACGMTWAIYSLTYLRHRFSIVPEARGLVTSGPYEVVRHPVYLGEIISGLGLVLPTLLTLHFLIFALFFAAQVARTYYEERVLRSAYPTYEIYAKKTRRLIPFIL